MGKKDNFFKKIFRRIVCGEWFHISCKLTHKFLSNTIYKGLKLVKEGIVVFDDCGQPGHKNKI